MAGRGDDYDVDDEPLAFVTSDYPSPYTFESRLNMQRRFFVRGKRRARGWRRLVLWVLFWSIAGPAFAGVLMLLVTAVRSLL